MTHVQARIFLQISSKNNFYSLIGKLKCVSHARHLLVNHSLLLFRSNNHNTKVALTEEFVSNSLCVHASLTELWGVRNNRVYASDFYIRF